MVDDGSTDDTGAALSRLASAQPRLRVVTPPRNVGRAAARNLGWREARGRWILFLDDDILTPPGLLRAHLDLLTSRPDAGTIGPAVTAPEIVDAPISTTSTPAGWPSCRRGPRREVPGDPERRGTPRGAPRWEASTRVRGLRLRGHGHRLPPRGRRGHASRCCRPVPLAHPSPHAGRLPREEAHLRPRLAAAIAARHPGRGCEMRLDLVTDAPGSPPPGRAASCAPRCAAGRRGWRCAWPAVWPPPDGTAPVLPALHHRCLDACVLTCVLPGVAEAGHRRLTLWPSSAIMTVPGGVVREPGRSIS